MNISDKTRLIAKKRKSWSFVVFIDDRPLMYYPYKFLTKARCKATANILADILKGNRVCIYDDRHYPDLFEDLQFAPNDNIKTGI